MNQTIPENDILKVHFNKMQMLSLIVDAHDETIVAGRGTGKTSGPHAHKTQRNMHSMPRCLGAEVASTFQQLLVRTLPAVIQGWERMGYRRDEHFFIGHYAPKKMGWDRPYLAPIDAKYLIHWYTGAAILMISQDGVGMANGLSLDFLYGDEAKFIDYEKLAQETLPTLRGNLHHFGHLSEHHSTLWTTDRPTNSKGRWVYKNKDLTNQDQIKLIVQAEYEMGEIIRTMDSYAPSYQKAQLEKINRYKKMLSIVRRNCVHYHEASALDNIGILGMDYIKQMKRNMSDVEFRTSILNEEIYQVEGGFYARLDDKKHCYSSYDYSHFENTGYDLAQYQEPDCRSDGDIIRSLPLDIAIDYNSSINVMSVGQWIKNDLRVINAPFVKHPDVLRHLLQKFCDYYRFLPSKVVNYYYDHTAIGKSASSIKSFKDEVQEFLIDKGWTVNMHYTGQAPAHEDKYRLISMILEESVPDLPKLRFNEHNCKSLLLSMKLAGVKQGKNGWHKDKSSESNKKIPAEEATHPSDSLDMLVWGRCKAMFAKKPDDFMGNIFS